MSSNKKRKRTNHFTVHNLIAYWNCVVPVFIKPMHMGHFVVNQLKYTTYRRKVVFHFFRMHNFHAFILLAAKPCIPIFLIGLRKLFQGPV